MKNTIKIINIGLICLAFQVHANASSILNNIYLKAGIGGIKYKSFKKTGGYEKSTPKSKPVYNIGVGYRFTQSIRTDLNFRYSKLNYKDSNTKQKIKTYSILANLYYDFKLYKNIFSYVTAGLGVGNNKAGDFKSDLPVAPKGKRKSNFIWNIGAGVQYKLNKNLALDLGYKYIDLGNTKTKNVDLNSALQVTYEGGRQRIKGHQFIASLIYNI